jgi:hypothetical protein
MAACLTLLGKLVRDLESSYVPVALTQPCPVPATIGLPLVSRKNSPPPVIPFHFPVPCKNFHFPLPVESSTADDEVAVRDQELAVAESFPLDASDTHDTGALVRGVVEGFVLRVAARD